MVRYLLIVLSFLHIITNSAHALDMDLALQVARSMYVSGSIPSEYRDGWSVSLVPCADNHQGLSHELSNGDQFGEISNYEREYGVIRIASVVEQTRAELISAGYPIEVWEGFLEKYVAEVSFDEDSPTRNEHYQSMLVALNTYRMNQAPSLPESVMGQGCFDGEILVQLRSEPAGAKIWLTSEFDYKICQLQGDDAKDVEICRWREETDGVFAAVAGNYRIILRWPDGSSSFTTRHFLRDGSTDHSENTKLRADYAVVLKK